MVQRIFLVARHTFLSNMRNRLFFVLILFGLLLIACSILFGVLSQEQEIRMLVDLGLASIEWIALLCSVYLMGHLVLEEMDSKTIYLLLTRSLTRGEYIFGRFLGALSSISVCMVVMSLAQLGLLLFKGWNWKLEGTIYGLSLFTSFEKIVLISAISLFFSLFSSSAIVSLVFSFFFWILGHFALELKFLSHSVSGGSKLILKLFYFLIPHFQYLNARDIWIIESNRLFQFVVQGFLYTLVYTAFSLGLAIFLFQKKEF